MAVVHRGRFEQVGTPTEVYEEPATPFVAEFLGRTIVFEGRIAKNHAGCWVDLGPDGMRILLDSEKSGSFNGGEKVRLFTRPEDIEILRGAEVARYPLAAKIEQVAYLGDHIEYHVQAAGVSFVVSASKKQRLAVGTEVWLALDPAHFTIRPV
jgi:ABC-type Fe3+/spermidine/putrescine transport system ATPase subunit